MLASAACHIIIFNKTKTNTTESSLSGPQLHPSIHPNMPPAPHPVHHLPLQPCSWFPAPFIACLTRLGRWPRNVNAKLFWIPRLTSFIYRRNFICFIWLLSTKRMKVNYLLWIRTNTAEDYSHLFIVIREFKVH